MVVGAGVVVLVVLVGAEQAESRRVAARPRIVPARKRPRGAVEG
jgi:hypothetical protein